MFMSVLPHTIELQRLSTSVDADGGKEHLWAPRTSGIACLITQQGGAGPSSQTHTVAFPSRSVNTADVQVGDRILVTVGPGFTTGLYLTVDAITQHGGVGGIDAFTRITARQILESAVPGGRL